MSDWSSFPDDKIQTDAWRHYLAEGLMDNSFFSGLRVGPGGQTATRAEKAPEEEEEEEEEEEPTPPPSQAATTSVEDPVDVDQALGDKPEVSFGDAPTNRQQRRAAARGEKGSSKDTARTPEAKAKADARRKARAKAQRKARRKNRKKEHVEIGPEDTELISESVINQWQKLAGINPRAL